MPCHLHLYSFLDNLKFLCTSLERKPNTSVPSKYSGTDDSDEIWIDTDDSENGKQNWKPSTNWLNSCISDISPFSDVLVLSNPERTLFLTSKFTKTEENGESQKFVLAADKYLAVENGEEVTSILCLPIFYQRKSQHSSPDWTCVIIGFSSGYLRMYTESGELLFSQQVFDFPIRNMHYEMYNSVEYEGDLVIEGDIKVVAIEGFVLLQTLKVCRNQLARSKAGKGDIAQPPPLLCKRWAFPEAKHFQSCAIIGHKSLSMFDYLMSETLHNGPSTYPQSSTPVVNSALTTGGDLFLGFHNITESATPQALSDVAVALASKLKTMFTPSIGSRLWNNAEEKGDVQNVANETYANIPLRFGFYDKTKQGTKIYLSPDRNLAAVTDNHNRVLLIDVNRGLCIRIFKGYRDAQCGWMRSDEADESEGTVTADKKGQNSRKVHYLIIYSPKRGIIEVWLAPKGHKVAAFSVKRMGKLFYPGISVLGLNGVQQQQMRKISSKIGSLIPCCLLEPNGNIMAIATSFKDALLKPLDSHSRDASLYEDLQKCIKSYSNDMEEKYVEEMKSIIFKLESYEFLKKAVHLLIVSFASKIHCKDLFLSCINGMVQRFKLLDELSNDQQRILLSCMKILQLAETHKGIQKINYDASKETPDKDCKFPADLQTLSSVFSVTERETADIISALSLHSEVTMNRSSKRKRVSFVEEFDTDSLGFFLDQFQVFGLEVWDGEIDSCTIPVHFDEHKLDSLSLGQLLFDAALKNHSFVGNITKSLNLSGISGLDLIKLLLSHWLTGTSHAQHWKHWINLHQLLKFCFLKISTDGAEVLSPLDNNNSNINSWKDEVLTMLAETSNLEAAYIASWLFRALLFSEQSAKDDQFLSKLESNEESVGSDDAKDWESFTEESIAWKILGNRLEDLLVLDSLLKAKEAQRKKEISPSVVHVEPSYGICHPISVSEILQRGQGSISEIVAEWAVFNDLPPDFFKYEPAATLTTPNEDKLDSPEPLYEADGKRLTPLKNLLREVSKRFPRSCDTEAILANTSWENIVAWNKKPDKITKLQLAQKHLNTIKSSQLKNGVACMMWKSFILPRFEALALLMEKVGKTPKDRLCKQDLLMSANHLETFLEVCCNLLEYLLNGETGRTEEEESVTPFPPDDLWRQSRKEKPDARSRTRSYSGGNKPGLVVLASDMGPPHFSAVHYHLSLAKVLLFVVTFELKNTRPLSNFYDKEARAFFFGELHKEVSMEYNNIPSTSVQSCRVDFLKKVAASIAHRIPDIPPPNSQTSTMGSTTPREISQNCPLLEASKWINNVIHQAKAWSVNADEVRRHYVCELYSCGHDRHAEETMTSIVNTRALASELLVLGGQRLANIVLSSTDTNVKLADLPPKLSSWIRTLNTGSLKSGNISLEATKTLIGHVISFIDDEKSADYNLSLDLFEAINNLM